MMTKTLAHFRIARKGEDYLLVMEDEDGDVTEFACDYDVLDLVTHEIDDKLDRDEEEMLTSYDEMDAGED